MNLEYTTCTFGKSQKNSEALKLDYYGKSLYNMMTSQETLEKILS